jgi:enoyl-CoA hydratase/carnithine racemase
MRGDAAEVVARIEAEVTEFRERLRSPEAIEALTAFFEKRPPNFRKTI